MKKNEKIPSTWEIIEDGAWGKMKYNLSGEEFEFVFNGHGLEPNTEYALIYYADIGQLPNFSPWIYNGGSLATGTSNRGGNIHIADSVDLNTSLPIEGDQNAPGAKIWLVLTADYDTSTGTFSAWNPTEYLFEYELISYEDTDD